MMIGKLLRDRNGATAIEYGVLTGIMAVALMSGFGAYGNALSNELVYLSNIINP